MPKLSDYPPRPQDTRRSSSIRAAWGTTPPETLERAPYTFWDGTTIPGGIHPHLVNATKWLDRVFQRHQYYLNATEDDWAYNRRVIKGTNVWSLHAWAIAYDINSQSNVYSRRFVTDLTPAIIADIQALKAPNGRTMWAWGGHWGGRGRSYDPMHFQTNLSPAEALSVEAPPPLIDVDGIDDGVPVAPELSEVWAALDALKRAGDAREVRVADLERRVGDLDQFQDSIARQI